MNRQMYRTILLALLIVLNLATIGVQKTWAQEADEIEIVGVVTSIDEENRTFDVKTTDGRTFIVHVDEDFDFDAINVGDTIEVEGTLAEDGSILADKIEIDEPDQDDEEDDEDNDPSSGYFCQNVDHAHPFGARLAKQYEADYETLLGWFCNGYGWGQVMLTLRTGQITGVDPGEILDMRSEGNGWGHIWQTFDLIGQRDDRQPGGPPEVRPGGPPEVQPGRGNGRP